MSCVPVAVGHVTRHVTRTSVGGGVCTAVGTRGATVRARWRGGLVWCSSRDVRHCLPMCLHSGECV